MLATVGALFGGAFVVPLPEDDQSLVPSAFFARTCTWYAVLAVNPVIVALVAVVVVSVFSVQVVAVCSFQRQS